MTYCNFTFYCNYSWKRNVKCFGHFNVKSRSLASRGERSELGRSVLRECFGRDSGGRRSGPFFSRELFFDKRGILSNDMYSRETLTCTSSERLSPSNFGVQVCWDMSVQMQMHTLWRFAGEPSRMPSVSRPTRALWAACIHSGDGATTATRSF